MDVDLEMLEFVGRPDGSILNLFLMMEISNTRGRNIKVRGLKFN